MKKVVLVVIPLMLALPIKSEDSFLNRLSFRVDYGYENWQAVFDSMSILTLQGDSTIEYNSTKKDIDWNNEHYDFYDHTYNFGFGVGLKVAKGLTLNAGAGLSFLRIETYDVDYEETTDTDERVLDFVFINQKPGFYVSGGLDFHFPLYKGLSISALPEISYLSIRDMQAIDPDHDGDIPDDYTVHQEMFLWNIDLVTSYDFGRLSPYIGGRYLGFRQNVDYDETEDYFGEEVSYDRETFLKPQLSFAGIAGLRIGMGTNNALSLEAALGKGFSISTRLQFGL